MITSSPHNPAPVRIKFFDFSHCCEEASVSGILIVNIVDNMISTRTSN